MKKYAPLATLVAVVLLGGGLLVANMLSNPANRTTTTAAPPSAAAAAAPSEWAGAAAAPSAVDPAPQPAPPVVAEKAYTGRSAGNEVTVAIAVKNGKAVAYACDGKKIEAWLEGTLTGGNLSLQGKSSSITATVDEKATLGSITVDAKEWPFAAKGVASPAGLYEGRGTLKGVAARVGWIVDDNGNVTGGMTLGGERRPAPTLTEPAPGPLAVDGGTLTVTALDGGAVVISR